MLEKLLYMDIILVGKKIKELRIFNKMTQEELAKLLYVSKQAVSKWEKGVTLPDIENIIKICELFNVDINYLLDLEFNR